MIICSGVLELSASSSNTNKHIPCSYSASYTIKAAILPERPITVCKADCSDVKNASVIFEYICTAKNIGMCLSTKHSHSQKAVLSYVKSASSE